MWPVAGTMYLPWMVKPAKSCGPGAFEYEGAPTMAARWSLDTRTAIRPRSERGDVLLLFAYVAELSFQNAARMEEPEREHARLVGLRHVVFCKPWVSQIAIS